MSQVLDPELTGKASGAAAGLCKFVGAMVPWPKTMGKPLDFWDQIVGKNKPVKKRPLGRIYA